MEGGCEASREENQKNVVSPRRGGHSLKGHVTNSAKCCRRIEAHKSPFDLAIKNSLRRVISENMWVQKPNLSLGCRMNRR